MKKLSVISFTVLVFFLAGSVLAEEKTTFNYKAEITWLSQYVSPLSGITSFAKEVVQYNLVASHNLTGIYANLWGSGSPSGGFNSDSGDRVYYIIGINKNIRQINLDAYFGYYNLYNIEQHGVKDIWSSGLRIKFPQIWKVNPYIMAEYDMVRGFSDKNGLLYRFGFNFLPVKNLITDLSVAGHSRIFGAKEEIVSSAKARFAYEFSPTKGFKIIPEVNFQKALGYGPLEEAGEGLTKDRIWCGVKMSYAF